MILLLHAIGILVQECCDAWNLQVTSHRAYNHHRRCLTLLKCTVMKVLPLDPTSTLQFFISNALKCALSALVSSMNVLSCAVGAPGALSLRRERRWHSIRHSMNSGIRSCRIRPDEEYVIFQRRFLPNKLARWMSSQDVRALLSSDPTPRIGSI